MDELATSGAPSRRVRRKQRRPGYCPFFRKIGRRKVQDGYRVHWYEADGRRRTWVKTEKEAQDLVQAKEGAEVLTGAGYNQVATLLDPLQIRAAEKAFQLLHDGSYLDLKDPSTAKALVESTQWFLSNYRPPTEAPTIADFSTLFFKSRSHRDKRTQDDYRSNLKLFIAAFGAVRIDSITSAQISEFLHARPLSNTTKRKLWSILRAFFNVACRKTEYGPPWLVDNPVKEVTPPVPVEPKRIIYTLPEVKDLIQVSIYIGCAPLVVFRLFTMLRADEAKRFLSAPAVITSEDNENAARRKKKRKTPAKVGLEAYRTKIQWETRLIDYQEPTNSTYTRKIKLLPVLEQWLRLFEERKIPLINSRLEEEARRIAVPGKFGKGYDNLIRHTAISNYVNCFGSLADAAYAAGTSERIIKKHYHEFVTAADAEAYYNLTPEKFDLSLLYPGTRYRTNELLRQHVAQYPGLQDYLNRRAHPHSARTTQ